MVYICLFLINNNRITIEIIIRDNNNPTNLQLEYALKTCLRVSIGPSSHANCIAQDETKTPRISPLQVLETDVEDAPEHDEDEVPDFPTFSALSLFVGNVVVHIAGFVGRKVAKNLDCEPCFRSLYHTDKEYTRIRSDYILISKKDNGGLFIPSEDLVQVCKETEKTIRSMQDLGTKCLSSSIVVKKGLSRILRSNVFQELRSEYNGDHNPNCDHVMKLIQFIMLEYVKVRLYHVAKETTLALSSSYIRSSLTKLVTFKGQ